MRWLKLTNTCWFQVAVPNSLQRQRNSSENLPSNTRVHLHRLSQNQVLLGGPIVGHRLRL